MNDHFGHFGNEFDAPHEPAADADETAEGSASASNTAADDNALSEVSACALLKRVEEMDEAALDAELELKSASWTEDDEAWCVEAAEAIDAISRDISSERGKTGTAEEGFEAADEAPADRADETANVSGTDAARCYRLRAAGVSEGYCLSSGEQELELRGIRKLLMSSGGYFLPDIFHNLSDLISDNRLLILERTDRGSSVIEGCVVFQCLTFECADVAGRRIIRRVNMLRMLTVRNSPDRGELARRLCLEAMLRGTVRSIYDSESEPSCVGTMGVVMGDNRPALAWAARLGDQVRVSSPTDPVIADDPVLKAAERYAEAAFLEHRVKSSFRFVVANRLALIEAAHFHAVGVTDPGSADDPALRIEYDPTCTFQQQIRVVAGGLVSRNPRTLSRLGLTGDPNATVWGPPEAAGMFAGSDPATSDRTTMAA